jgi:hypothetical protein
MVFDSCFTQLLQFEILLQKECNSNAQKEATELNRHDVLPLDKHSLVPVAFLIS